MPNPVHIPRIEGGAGVAEALGRAPLFPIACNNWPEAFPATPRAGVRALHDGRTLYLRYEVEEPCARALVEADNGPVWTDSCAEFFLALDATGYYNFELSCNGTLLLAFRSRRDDPRYAPSEVMASVVRRPSLGRACFAERQGGIAWSAELEIPASALFLHRPASWDGLQARANFYKCGDGLSQPHYLSWSPVSAPAPDFHRPESFRELIFDTAKL